MKPIIYHRCGCSLKLITQNGFSGYTISQYCNSHKPNYAKKSNELIHGYDKQKKRNKYLELRQEYKRKMKHK